TILHVASCHLKSRIGRGFENKTNPFVRQSLNCCRRTQGLYAWATSLQAPGRRIAEALRLRCHSAQMERKELVHTIPRITQNMFAAEIVKLAGVDHELHQT